MMKSLFLVPFDSFPELPMASVAQAKANLCWLSGNLRGTVSLSDGNFKRGNFERGNFFEQTKKCDFKLILKKQRTHDFMRRKSEIEPIELATADLPILPPEIWCRIFAKLTPRE